MPGYNLQKQAQQQPPAQQAGQQQAPNLGPQGAIALQQQLQVQAQLTREAYQNYEAAAARLKRDPQNPQLIQIVEEYERALKVEQDRLRFWQGKMWDYQNSVQAEVRKTNQDVVRAILENDDQVLSQLSGEEYLEARNKFLRTAPKIGSGETEQQYRARIEEWLFAYNPSGDLVKSYANLIIQNLQQNNARKAELERQRNANKNQRQNPRQGRTR